MVMEKSKTVENGYVNNKRSMAIKDSVGERIFYIANYILFVILGLATLFPFLNLVAKSLSGEAAVISGTVGILPVDFQTGTYKFVLNNKQFMNSFRITIFITVVGTVLSLLMTVITAYPLSKPGLRGRKYFMLIFVFTMLFNGGLIPTYLLMQKIGLVNKIGSLILPGMLSIYNMLIVKSSFESLPDSLEESAKLDGASNITVLFRIILPLSKPMLATIALFYAVGLWNSYFSAMIYITKPELKPLQLYLKELLASTEDALKQGNGVTDLNLDLNKTPEAVRAASIITATVPILCVYPFLQKYFVKGVLVGSVKG